MTEEKTATTAHSTTDPYRLHGIRHFTESQGLPEYDGTPPASIVYGDAKSPIHPGFRRF